MNTRLDYRGYVIDWSEANKTEAGIVYSVRVEHEGAMINVAAASDDPEKKGRAMVDEYMLGSDIDERELSEDLFNGQFVASFHSGVCPVCENLRLSCVRNRNRWSVCRWCFVKLYTEFCACRQAPAPDADGQPIYEADIIFGFCNTHSLFGMVARRAEPAFGFGWMSEEERHWEILQLYRLPHNAPYNIDRSVPSHWVPGYSSIWRLYYHKTDAGGAVYRVVGRHPETPHVWVPKVYPPKVIEPKAIAGQLSLFNGGE